MAVPLDSPQIDPTQELAGSEIVSFKVDPVLFVHLLTTDISLKRMTVTYFTQFTTGWSN